MKESDYSCFEDIIEKEDSLKFDNMQISNNVVKVNNDTKINTNMNLLPNLQATIPLVNEPIKNKISLLSFQIPIIDKLYKHYIEGNDKCTMIIPCGMGKSYISLFLIRKMEIKLSVIFVPTLILSEQFENIAKNVLTDYTIFRFCGEVNKNDVVAQFCKYYKKNKIVIICTYDSAADLYKCFGYWELYPVLNVYDEVHNTTIVSKTIEQESIYRDIIFLK